MAFGLFILLNGILFIRPAELIPILEPFRLYLIVMFFCITTSGDRIFHQLEMKNLVNNPITLCCLGLLVSVVMSHLRHGSIYDARFSGAEFIKLVIYYLLCLSCINTPSKLNSFISWFLVFTLISTVLALLQFYGLVNIPALAAYEQREFDEITGEFIIFSRLCGSGLFNDPNDICLILMVSTLLCLHRLMSRPDGISRFLYLAPISVYLLAIAQTQSRGGFLSLTTSLLVWSTCFLGFKKTLMIGSIALPFMIYGIGGRITNIDIENGTGQHRIQLWREALELMREYPLFGIGQGMLPEYTRLVAHNSYVHAYSELGFFGGTCFVGLVFLSIAQLIKMPKTVDTNEDSNLVSLRPYILGIVCGYSMGIMTLSRVYSVPTYLIFGLAATYLSLCELQFNRRINWRVNLEFMFKLCGISLVSLLALEIGSRLLVNWEG
ncbi:MAG: hypothetical protein COA78_06130 [Blastopirellula sp.]|nr:MAG: hypothetical protein COA78_06130 [Blastopirellula sp.]